MSSPQDPAAGPDGPAPDRSRDAHRHLLHPRHLDDYQDAMLQGLATLSAELDAHPAPASGQDPLAAATEVAAVDLDRPLPDLDSALTELREVWLRDAVWFHEPGYAAHLNCPVVIPAVMAESLIGAVNASLDTFDQSVGATFMERHLIDWTAARIGWALPALRPDGIFTSGGSQSNLQGLLLARESATEQGVPLTEMRVLCSAEAHFSVHRSARLLGLAPDAVVSVETDSRRRMDPEALRRRLEELDTTATTPVAVVATAGTTDFGAIDPIDRIAPLAHAHDAWLHVDAAYGGGLLASTTHRHRLAGIELADSVTVDYHKTWFQPVSSSALLVREGADLRHVTWHADYLNPADATNPNQVDKSLQTTRRFDALKLWLTLRVLGADVIGGYVDQVIALADAVHETLESEYAELEAAAHPELSTLVFRFLPTDRDLGPEEVDRLNQRIREQLYRDGQAIVAATRVEGRRFLKLTLLNPIAEVVDILEVLDRVCLTGRAIARELPGGPERPSPLQEVRR